MFVIGELHWNLSEVVSVQISVHTKKGRKKTHGGDSDTKLE